MAYVSRSAGRQSSKPAGLALLRLHGRGLALPSSEVSRTEPPHWMSGPKGPGWLRRKWAWFVGPIFVGGLAMLAFTSDAITVGGWLHSIFTNGTPGPKPVPTFYAPSHVLGRVEPEFNNAQISDPIELDVGIKNDGSEASHAAILTLRFGNGVWVEGPKGFQAVGPWWAGAYRFEDRSFLVPAKSSHPVGQLTVRLPPGTTPVLVASYELTGEFDQAIGMLLYDPATDSFVKRSVGGPEELPAYLNATLVTLNQGPPRPWFAISDEPHAGALTNDHFAFIPQADRQRIEVVHLEVMNPYHSDFAGVQMAVQYPAGQLFDEAIRQRAGSSLRTVIDGGAFVAGGTLASKDRIEIQLNMLRDQSNALDAGHGTGICFEGALANGLDGGKRVTGFIGIDSSGSRLRLLAPIFSDNQARRPCAVSPD
jgi:hypothetical protein